MTLTEKLTIAQNICAPLLRKIKDDLQRNAYLDDDSVHRLDFRYTTGVASPDRHVRTRLYFTSESHIHSLLTMLTEGGLIDVSDFFCIFLSQVQIGWKKIKNLKLVMQKPVRNKDIDLFFREMMSNGKELCNMFHW